MKNDTTNTTAIETFNFHGDELAVVSLPNGEHFVVLARLCAPFGLDVKTQAEKLKALAWAGWGIIPVPSAGGTQDTFCLNIRSVAGWLFTLNAKKIAEPLREKLALYQRECADVLADHFYGKRNSAAPFDLAAIRDMVRAEIDTVRAEVLAIRDTTTAMSNAGPCIGVGGARVNVLLPLMEIARLEAKVYPNGESRVASLRTIADLSLREALNYPIGSGGQTWAMFPMARLGELTCALTRLKHHACKRLGMATPKPVQLSLVANKNAKPATGA